METANRSDPSLVQACIDGHQWAWNALVERYERLVYSVALKARLSHTDADDVFQSVFISLYRNLSKLNDQTRLSAWLITSTQREAWRVARRRNKLVSSEEQNLEPVHLSTDELEIAERQHLVRQGLKSLGGPCEQLLLAMFVESDEPNYAEIAKKLDMPIGSVGPTRARCLKKLERILTKLGIDAPRALWDHSAARTSRL